MSTQRSGKTPQLSKRWGRICLASHQLCPTQVQRRQTSGDTPCRLNGGQWLQIMTSNTRQRTPLSAFPSNLENMMSFPILNMKFLLNLFQILVPLSQTRNLRVAFLDLVSPSTANWIHFIVFYSLLPLHTQFSCSLYRLSGCRTVLSKWPYLNVPLHGEVAS